MTATCGVQSPPTVIAGALSARALEVATASRVATAPLTLTTARAPARLT